MTIPCTHRNKSVVSDLRDISGTLARVRTERGYKMYPHNTWGVALFCKDCGTRFKGTVKMLPWREKSDV